MLPATKDICYPISVDIPCRTFCNLVDVYLDVFLFPNPFLFFFGHSLQDFYNLVDVYLDAVFFPNCVRDEKTFQQEGWHYELNESSEDITYKGMYVTFQRYCK